MINIHPLFFIMLFIWLASGHISQYVVVIGSLLWHELGHVLLARWRHVQVKQLLLLPFGGRLTLEQTATYQDKSWIALGGPIFTIIAYASTSFLPPLWQQPWQQVQLLLLVINCLPVYPLDGGQFLCNVLLIVYKKKKIYEAYVSLSFYFITIIVVVALLMLPQSMNLAVLSLLLWSEVIGEWKFRKYRSAYEKLVMNRLT